MAIRGIKRYIGTKEFYRNVILISLPIILQQGITTFVGLLDNIMVGNYNYLAMSGVGVANQIYFIINIVTFGGLAAPGIFLAQFFGAKDTKGMQSAIRFKAWLGLLTFLIATTLLLLYGDIFIKQFLKNQEKPEEAKAIFEYAKIYLIWMIGGLVPFIVSQIYSGTLRETGETRVPMVAGMISVVVNFCFNFLLINGNFGFPKLGVTGAAIATIIARFVEMTIIIVVVHRNYLRYTFAKGLWKSLRIPMKLMKKITLRGTPLIVNEFLWALGMTTVVALYSVRGTHILTAINISGTTTNLFFIIFGAMATSISVIIGQALGAGKLDEAREAIWKLLAFALFVCVITSLILASVSFFIPMIYRDVDRDTRLLATFFMLVVASCYPIFAFNAGCFFTLRAGGVTIVTFLFDSLFIWVLYIPLAYFLVHYTSLSIVLVYLIVQLSEIIKSFIGFALIKSEIWVKNLVSKPAVEELLGDSTIKPTFDNHRR